MSEFKSDLKWSARLFRSQVWPILEQSFAPTQSRLIQMEDCDDSELVKTFDVLAGIDAWHVCHIGMRGIASRIQECNTGRTYDTFTIRKSRDSGAETEYKKRLNAVYSKSGWLYPFLTVQAYVKTKTGPVLSIGMARTSDIIGFIEKGYASTRRTTNAEFWVCGWGDMIDRGYDVKSRDYFTVSSQDLSAVADAEQLLLFNCENIRP